MTATTLVIGLGNRLRGDDGVGPLVADAIRERLAAGELTAVDVLDGGIDAMDIVNAWRNRSCVHVVDALRASRAPGDILCLPVGAATNLGELSASSSSHALGLREAVELGRSLDALPSSLVFWGIVGERFGIGDELTPAVGAALPDVVDRLARALSGDAEG